MNIKQRLEILEDAHRALAAQHTALMAICRVILPLIDTHPELVKRQLVTAYDVYSEHMDNSGQDAEYQADVRAGIDLLSRPILLAANIRQRAMDDPESLAGSPE